MKERYGIVLLLMCCCLLLSACNNDIQELPQPSFDGDWAARTNGVYGDITLTGTEDKVELIGFDWKRKSDTLYLDSKFGERIQVRFRFIGDSIVRLYSIQELNDLFLMDVDNYVDSLDFFKLPKKSNELPTCMGMYWTVSFGGPYEEYMQIDRDGNALRMTRSDTLFATLNSKQLSTLHRRWLQIGWNEGVEKGVYAACTGPMGLAVEFGGKYSEVNFWTVKDPPALSFLVEQCMDLRDSLNWKQGTWTKEVYFPDLEAKRFSMPAPKLVK